MRVDDRVTIPGLRNAALPASVEVPERTGRILRIEPRGPVSEPELAPGPWAVVRTDDGQNVEAPLSTLRRSP